MKVENLESIPGVIREIVRHLNESPGDHYAVVFFGSKSADQAEMEGTAQIHQLVDALQKSDLPSFLRPSRATVIIHPFRAHGRSAVTRVLDDPKDPDSAA